MIELRTTPEDERTLLALRDKLAERNHPARYALDRLLADHRTLLRHNVELLGAELARKEAA